MAEAGLSFRRVYIQRCHKKQHIWTLSCSPVPFASSLVIAQRNTTVESRDIIIHLRYIHIPVLLALLPMRRHSRFPSTVPFFLLSFSIYLPSLHRWSDGAWGGFGYGSLTVRDAPEKEARRNLGKETESEEAKERKRRRTVCPNLAAVRHRT